MKSIFVVSFGLVVGLAVVGATVGLAVGATVVGAAVGCASGAFVVVIAPSPVYVYLTDVIFETLLPLTAATPTVYSPEPFVNTDFSRLTEFPLTFVAYTPST